MDEHIIYVGLDVHKETISVALADGGKRGEVRGHFEVGAITDCGDDRRGHVWVDALEPRDAPAGLALAMDPVDLPVEARDAAVELAEQLEQIVGLDDRLAGPYTRNLR